MRSRWRRFTPARSGPACRRIGPQSPVCGIGVWRPKPLRVVVVAEVPDELVPQLPLVRRLVAALAIPVLEERGVEADDVIGTLATRAAEAGTDVVIVTGDKDFQQLVSRRISLLDTMYGKRTTLEDVRARYGLEP